MSNKPDQEKGLLVTEDHQGNLIAAEQSESNQLMSMIADAASSGNMEMVERMMDMKDRHEANEARKAYVSAMASFKAQPPEILKTAYVAHTDSWHAKLGESAEVVNSALGEHGLFMKWITEQTPELITVTCVISHKLGHSESTTMSAPPDTSGKKNVIQSIASSVTYLQRYTMSAILGLVSKDQNQSDNDGNGDEWRPKEYIKGKDLEEIKTTLGDVDMSDEKLVRWLQGPHFVKQNGYVVESMEEIPSEWMGDIKKMFEQL